MPLLKSVAAYFVHPVLMPATFKGSAEKCRNDFPDNFFAYKPCRYAQDICIIMAA